MSFFSDGRPVILLFFQVLYRSVSIPAGQSYDGLVLRLSIVPADSETFSPQAAMLYCTTAAI